MQPYKKKSTVQFSGDHQNYCSGFLKQFNHIYLTTVPFRTSKNLILLGPLHSNLEGKTISNFKTKLKNLY